MLALAIDHKQCRVYTNIHKHVLVAMSTIVLHHPSSVDMPVCLTARGCLLQVTFPLVLDTYDFCSDDLKKQLDGPRVAVREEEDRKANKDRAVKKAKMVRLLQHGLALRWKYHQYCVQQCIVCNSANLSHLRVSELLHDVVGVPIYGRVMMHVSI